MELKSRHKVACLLLSLDRELAGRVLRSMREEDVHALTHAMKDLEEISLDDSTIKEVLLEAVKRLRRGGLALGNVGDAMVEAFSGHGIASRALVALPSATGALVERQAAQGRSEDD